MRAIKAGLLCLMLSSLAACGNQVVEFEIDSGSPGKDGGPVADGGATDAGTDGGFGEAPIVLTTVPLDGATNVPFNTQISATFSEAMDPATLNGTTFTLKQGMDVLTGTVSYDAATNTATFTPDVALRSGLLYSATITTGAKDLGGTPLASNYPWSFTTQVNTAPPTLVSTTPLNGAMNASISTKPTGTFSKPMNPMTINDQTFTLQEGPNPISGMVSFDPATNTATFTPAMVLAVDTTYTATITTGARDLDGNALIVDHVWSFTTSACALAPVVLGSAANFAVLAGSTVTNVGPTSVTGDLGVSPGTAVTGFPPGIVIGTQSVGDPGPAATGIADLTTAYNDAAGRSLCAVSKEGNLGGQTLTPGLYVSGTSQAITSGDLTLDGQGDPNSIFIFKSAETLTTTTGRQVILTNGANAANIFWQVGSSATLGTTSTFHGTIMADQAITLGTGATLNGRALARIAAVALDSNTIVKP